MPDLLFPPQYRQEMRKLVYSRMRGAREMAEGAVAALAVTLTGLARHVVGATTADEKMEHSPSDVI